MEPKDSSPTSEFEGQKLATESVAEMGLDDNKALEGSVANTAKITAIFIPKPQHQPFISPINEEFYQRREV